MNAKEYLNNKGINAEIEWLLEGYHQAKSKEEAKERYEKAIKLIPRHLGTLDKREVIEATRIASGIEQSK